MLNKLKFVNYDIVFQEVPNEVSLAFNISNCPHKCPGCHSDYLAQDIGEILEDKIDEILNRYKGMITCVCFMGGDQESDNLVSLLRKIREEYWLKTCLYTGLDDLVILHNVIPYLDYLKIGSYKEELGGLIAKTTNQRFYKIENGSMEDITYLFWREKQK